MSRRRTLARGKQFAVVPCCVFAHVVRRCKLKQLNTVSKVPGSALEAKL